MNRNTIVNEVGKIKHPKVERTQMHAMCFRMPQRVTGSSCCEMNLKFNSQTRVNIERHGHCYTETKTDRENYFWCID